MQNKVYIQQINGQYADDWTFAAFLGFSKLGFTIINFEEIEEVPFRKDIFVVAFIEDTTKFFNALRIKRPDALNIPDNLNTPEFLNRKVFKTTYGELKVMPINFPIFIKPIQIKKFESGVITKLSTLDGLNITDSDEVLISEVIEMDSEYRIFVHDGNIVGMQCYAGDPFLVPDRIIVEKMITSYVDSPIAYTLDISVNKSNTSIIECNDAWSIGNYGLEAKKYALMLRDRWSEIMRENADPPKPLPKDSPKASLMKSIISLEEMINDALDKQEKEIGKKLLYRNFRAETFSNINNIIKVEFRMQNMENKEFVKSSFRLGKNTFVSSENDSVWYGYYIPNLLLEWTKT